MFPATCSECGKETMVPFRPSGDKPVYCKECYRPRSR
jgi:CxxC-x17-CxxC domain-containing protein